MGFFSWLFGNDYDETPVPPEPRLSSGEFEKGFAEIKGLVAAEEERLRLQREAEERARKLREAEERERAANNSDNGFRGEARFMRGLDVADFNHINSLVERNMTFGRKLAQYVQDRCGGKASICYQGAGVSRQVYSKIISDPNKTVTRRTALQLCIGLKLNRKEAEDFIGLAGYSFSPSSFEDTVFAWCFEHGAYNMNDINDFLVRAGEEPIRLN